MNYNDKKEQALKNAFASTRMEGYNITSQAECNARKILSGELTVEQRVLQIKAAQQRKKK